MPRRRGVAMASADAGVASAPIVVDAATLSGPRFAALPPLALYVHIPWCLKKCPYCDFNSHEAKGEAPEAAYVDALLADLEFALPSIWGRRVVSVFIGGGTPSLFSAARHRSAARGHSRARRRWRRTPRSRWKRIRGRSSAASSPGSRRRNQSAVARHPELRSEAPGRDRPRARRRRGAARGGRGARDLRQRQLRPDVRAAAPDGGRRGSRCRGRARVRAAAPVVLPPDARAQHAVPPVSAAAARRRDGGRHRGCGRRDARRGGIPALRNVRARAERARMPAQSQLLAVRRLPRHRRRRALEAVVRRSDRAPGSLQAAEAVSGAGGRGRAAAGGRRRDARGCRFRVHAERVAADRRRSGGALRRAHGLSAGAGRTRARSGRGARPDRARSGGAAADGAGTTVPQRSAGALSRRRRAAEKRFP